LVQDNIGLARTRSIIGLSGGSAPISSKAIELARNVGGIKKLGRRVL